MFEWINESNENDQFVQLRRFDKKAYSPDLHYNDFFRWMHSPETIEDLLEIDEALVFLTKGIIFFHNKKPSVNNLLGLMANKLNSYDEEIKIFKIGVSQLSLTDINNGAWSEKEKKTLLLVDASENPKSAIVLLKSLTTDMADNVPTIWLYGNIEHLSDCLPDAFDALFFFDTSSHEYELIRKRIAISESMIRGLRIRPVNTLTNEGVILFLNYERRPNAPLLDANPKLLGLDITPGGQFQNVYIKEIKMSNSKFEQTIQTGGQGIQAEKIDKVTYSEGKGGKEIDLKTLSAELEKLSAEMSKEAKDMNQRRSAGAIAEAEGAAKEGDKKTTFEYLKKAGSWAFEFAEKLGLELAKDTIKSLIGIK